MNLFALQRHAGAAYDWLRPRLSEEGQWKDEQGSIVDAYYKVPWCLIANGATEATKRNLDFIEKQFLQCDGDLKPVHSSKLLERYPFIPHAHVAIGASLAGRQQLSDRLLDFLSEQRHPRLEAWGDRVDGVRPQRVDAISTACIGLACLDGGRLDAACSAAAFLERLLAAQPRAETDFFTTMDINGEVITEFPDRSSTIDRRVTFATQFQVWHAIGFPIMLFARLLEVDGNAKWRNLAEQFTSMFDRSGQAWIDLSVGKAGWGFAVLYRATGDRGYRRRALRTMRSIVSWQDADGGWLTCLEGAGGKADAVSSVGYEISAELVTWLSTVGGTIAAAEDTPWIRPADAPDRRLLDRWLVHADRRMERQRRVAFARWLRLRGRLRRR